MKTRSLAAVGAALLLALAGCSSTSGGTSGASASAESTDKGTLTVLSHDSFALPKDLIAKFEQESGYKLKTLAPPDASTIANELILAKGKPTADVVYGIDTFSAQRAVDADVLDDYASPNLPANRPVEQGKLNPIDDAFVAVNADKAYFEKNNLELPKSFEDLAKPEYAKLLAVENPASSSAGLAFLAGTVTKLNGSPEAPADFGGSPAGKYWKALLDGGTRIDTGWSDAYYNSFSASEKHGAYPLVVSYTSSPAAEKGKTVSINGTAISVTDYAAVIKGAKNPDGAKAFIDFLLSDEVQKAMPDSNYAYPVADVPLPAEWVKLAPAPNAGEAVQVPLEAAGKNFDEWIKGWRAVSGR